MKCFGLFLVCFTLCSCGTHTATNELVNAANNSVVALEKTLPGECATESVKTQIHAIKTQITAIESVCETEKESINKDKIKWQMAFWGLLVVVGAYLIKKVLK